MRKLAIIGAVALLVIALAVPAQAKFPAKDIILLCPWSAGGGTDTISRALVRDAKKYFGVNVNVVNKTGGMGAAATARPGGYTVGMITFQLPTYQAMGLAKLSYRNYELIQLVTQSPGSPAWGLIPNTRPSRIWWNMRRKTPAS